MRVKHDRIRPMGMQGKALRHAMRISPVPMPDKDQRALLNACMLRGAGPSRTHYPLDLQFDPLELCKGGRGKKKNTPKRMGKASHPDKQREGIGKLQALTCEPGNLTPKDNLTPFQSMSLRNQSNGLPIFRLFHVISTVLAHRPTDPMKLQFSLFGSAFFKAVFAWALLGLFLPSTLLLANNPPTGTVTITGTAQIGQILTVRTRLPMRTGSGRSPTNGNATAFRSSLAAPSRTE